MSSDGRVENFSEKPALNAVKGWELGPVSSGNLPRAHGPVFMASMGIYCIKFSALERMLDEDAGADFGRDVIPRAIAKQRVFAYPFVGYWEDIGTIRSYYDANIALTGNDPSYDLYDQQMRLFTRARFLPGAHLDEAHVNESLICTGARGRKLTAERSIIGTRAVLQDNVTVRDSYIVGADFYETPEELAENRALKRPDIGIGGDTTIRRAIVDKNARIGYGVTIDPPPNCANMDGHGYAVRDGIVIVEKGATIADGSRIPEVPRANR
jgi:glucose-1-phosphate adenylyltransferase